MPRRSRLALGAGLVLLAVLQGSAKPAAAPGFIGAFQWSDPAPDFGGLSGLHLSADGLEVLGLTDQARLVRAQLSRDGGGKIVGAKVAAVSSLNGPHGEALRSPWSDSEGLALGADGAIYVSFEGNARVWRYDAPDANAIAEPEDPDFAQMGLNSSLEALAIDAAGALYTLPEVSAGPDQPFKVYRLRNGKWDSRWTLPRRGNFLAVDADFGPDGRFYLLERAFYGWGGFATRLRRFTPTETGFANEETLLETPPGAHDNLEGLSIWRDSFGQLRATMVADDNFLWILHTELVEYRLPD